MEDIVQKQQYHAHCQKKQEKQTKIDMDQIRKIIQDNHDYYEEKLAEAFANFDVQNIMMGKTVSMVEREDLDSSNEDLEKYQSLDESYNLGLEHDQSKSFQVEAQNNVSFH